MTIKEKNLKLIMELIFIFILPLAVIGINCKLDNEYVYDNNGNFETSQKELSYSGINYTYYYSNYLHLNQLIGSPSGSITGNSTSARGCYLNAGHTYYIYSDYSRPSGTNDYQTFLRYNDNTILYQFQNTMIYRITPTTSGTLTFGYAIYSDYGEVVRYNLNVIDLTYMFGYGYEPSNVVFESYDFISLPYLSYIEDEVITYNSNAIICSDSALVSSPFVKFKYMVAGAFNVDNTDISFNIIFDYTCLWFLQFVIWHLLYGLFDFLMHLLTLKKKE